MPYLRSPRTLALTRVWWFLLGWGSPPLHYRSVLFPRLSIDWVLSSSEVAELKARWSAMRSAPPVRP